MLIHLSSAYLRAIPEIENRISANPVKGGEVLSCRARVSARSHAPDNKTSYSRERSAMKMSFHTGSLTRRPYGAICFCIAS
jgi:hypothetical protein